MVSVAVMLIHSYGLFWRRDEVNWHPGKGNRDFRLLGRQGVNKGTIRMADFNHQQGIYILYGDTGPHYVGLTRKQGFGKRLKDHTTDLHKKYWVTFSWFGFRMVNGGKDDKGFNTLREMPTVRVTDPNGMIKDIEALLINAMSLKNSAQMKFMKAKPWAQVKYDEVETLSGKL